MMLWSPSIDRINHGEVDACSTARADFASRSRPWASALPSWGICTGRPAMRRPRRRWAPRGRPGSATTTPPRTTGSACPSGGSARRSPDGRGTRCLVSTKVGRLLVPSPGDGGPAGRRGLRGAGVGARGCGTSARDGVRRSLDASLERLGLDRVDIVYLHDPDDHWHEASGRWHRRTRGAARAGRGRRHRRRDEPVRDAGRVRATPRRRPGDAAPVGTPCSTSARSTTCCPLAVRARCAASSRPGSTTPVCSAEPGRSPAPTYDYEPAPPELVDRARRLAAVCEAHGVDLPDRRDSLPAPAPGRRLGGRRGPHRRPGPRQRRAAGDVRYPMTCGPSSSPSGLVRTLDGARA